MIITTDVFSHRTKMNASKTSSGVAREKNKGCISTSTNLASGQVEGVKAVEYEMCDMPAGAAMATQEPRTRLYPLNDLQCLLACVYIVRAAENRGEY